MILLAAADLLAKRRRLITQQPQLRQREVCYTFAAASQVHSMEVSVITAACVANLLTM